MYYKRAEYEANSSQRRILSALIKQGLIDEFHLFINPIAICDGMTIFKELNSKQYLTLVKATSFYCGMVVLNYELKRD